MTQVHNPNRLRSIELLEAALNYAKNGYNVIPLFHTINGICSCKEKEKCNSAGKHPWAKWKITGGSTDPDQIKAWWQVRPISNIGIVTGKKSGILLLDVDGDLGKESIKNKPLPLTPTSKTGRGSHILFKYPDNDIDTKNKAGFLPGLDIRGDGGLFVAPPSKHYSGNLYEWLVSPDEIPLSDCPAWLIKYLKKPEIKKIGSININNRAKNNKKYGAKALQEESERVRIAPAGKRNDSLNKAAFALGQLVGGGELEEWEVINTLIQAAQNTGLPDHEITGTIESGLTAGKLEPRSAAPLKDLINFTGWEGSGNIDPETGEILYEKTEYIRPRLCVQEGDLHLLNPLIWNALKTFNNPPHLFRYAGRLQRFESDGEKWSLQELNSNSMRFEITEAIEWFKIKTNKEETIEIPAVPPRHIAENLLADSAPELPAVHKIVETPIFTKEGELIIEPGYHLSGILFHPIQKLNIKPVPCEPSEIDIKKAVSLIEELLCDFPFINNVERTNAISIFLDPFLREMIKGPTPLRLIEASTPGSGKGLLADVLTRHATKQPGLITQCHDEEEWNKSIISQLKANVSVILIDNITTVLDSGALAAALTSDFYGGRLLGTNDTVQWPNRALWLATSNNPTMTTEIARRTVRIRLDPKQDRPWQRENFKHTDLRSWAIDHQSELIWAALVIIQNWITKGKPDGKNKPLGSFEHWSKVMGGVLESAGFTEFLANLNEFYEVADREGTVLRNFVTIWWNNFQDQKVTIAQLFTLLENFDGFDLGRGGDRSQRITFSKVVSRQKDRVIDKFVIQNAGTYQGAAVWKLSLSTQSMF